MSWRVPPPRPRLKGESDSEYRDELLRYRAYLVDVIGYDPAVDPRPPFWQIIWRGLKR